MAKGSEGAGEPIRPAPADACEVGPGQRGGRGLAGEGKVRPGGAAKPPFRVEAGQRDNVAFLKPPRSGRPARAGGEPAYLAQDGDQPVTGRRGRAERDLELAASGLPGLAVKRRSAYAAFTERAR